MHSRGVLAAIIASSVALAAPRARADEPPTDAEARTFAEQLFLDARQLMQAKDYGAACPKFEESYRLDPSATGTLLNLALCYEGQGRTASAWSRFRAAAAQSRGTREDRVRLAEQHERALAPDLSFVTLSVPSAARVDGLQVKLDGRVIGPAAWGTALPVDPGILAVEASAPGTKKWRTTITIGKKNDKQLVAVPRLAPLAAAPTLAVAPLRETRPPPEPPADGAPNARRVAGFVVGGVGLAAIGVGAVFGVAAIGKNNDATARCPSDVCVSPADRDASTRDLSSARTSAAMANISIGLGVAAVVGGALLVLLNPARREAARISVLPLFFAGGGGASVGRSF